MNISLSYNKNVNLESNKVKNIILKYLYQNVEIGIRHEIISNVKILDYINSDEYIICPTLRGIRSWIIFFRNGDDYYAVSFPKTEKIRDNFRVYPLGINVVKEFYYGTIMEGIFYRMDDTRFLVIDEVYLLSGQNQLLKSKDDRLIDLTRYITKSIRINPDFQMYVSQFFNINKKSIRELYDKIKSDSRIQEIIFYPKIFGKKIYSYTILDSDVIDTVIKLSKFYLQKTESPDVYNLLTLEPRNKVGIAYIPNIDVSKKCKNWFKHNKKKELVVKCQLDIDKNKWIPLEVVNDDD